MLRIIKFKDKWVMVSADRKYIFVKKRNKDAALEIIEEWGFIKLIENIGINARDRLSFVKEPKTFESKEAGEQFVKDNFGSFFEEE